MHPNQETQTQLESSTENNDLKASMPPFANGVVPPISEVPPLNQNQPIIPEKKKHWYKIPTWLMIIVAIALLYGGYFAYNAIVLYVHQNENEKIVKQKEASDLDLRNFTISSVSYSEYNMLNVDPRQTYTFNLTNDKGYCGLTEFGYERNKVNNDKWEKWHYVETDYYTNDYIDIYNFKSNKLKVSDESRNSLIKIINQKFCPPDKLLTGIEKIDKLVLNGNNGIHEKVYADVAKDLQTNTTRSKSNYYFIDYGNYNNADWAIDLYYLQDNNWVYISTEKN